MRQAHSNRGQSAAAGAVLRRRRSRLAPAATTLVIVLMGCTNPMQTGSGTPPPGRLKLNVADAALAAGAPDMALRVADLILRGEPRNVPALVSKGDALYAMDLPDRARAAYRAALAVDPSSADALIGLGRTLVRSDPAAAAAAFGDAAALAPNNVAALSNLGIARDLQGQHEAAQAAYRQALAVAPGTADVKLNLGLSLALSGKPAEAVALLRPLAGQIDAAGVRRNDLAAALALAGDQVEAGLVQRGEARLADANTPPAATLPAETPLVALANPVQGHAEATPDKAVVPALDIRPAPVAPVMEVPGIDAPSRPAIVPAETSPVISGTPVPPRVTAAADNAVLPPLNIRPIQVVRVTREPGADAPIRLGSVPAETPLVASAAPVPGRVATAAENVVAPSRDIRPMQEVSATEVPSVDGPSHPATVSAEAPPVVSATPVQSHTPAAADNGVASPRDVRPMQMVSVTEAAGVGAPTRPATVPAETPKGASTTAAQSHTAAAVDNGVVPPRDVRPMQMASVTEAPGVGAAIQPAAKPAATPLVVSATPVRGRVAAAAGDGVVPPRDVRPKQAVSVTEAPSVGAPIRSAMVPAETPSIVSATPVQGRVAAAAGDVVVPPRDGQPTQIASVPEAPGVGAPIRSAMVPAETPSIVSVAPVQGHVAAAAGDSVVAPRDVRPTQVVSVTGAPADGAAIQPAARVASAPVLPQAHIWLSRRPDSAHEEPAAIATGVSAAGAAAPPPQVHPVTAAPPRPARTIANTSVAALPAPPARTQVALAPAAQTRTAPSDQSSQRFCQLAALDTEQRAMLEWQHLQTQIPELLDGRTPSIMPAEIHGRTFWRLRTGGFQSQSEQRDFCAHVRMLGLDCWWG